MIWNRRYKVCGTADLVQVIDGKIYVLDYKTNGRLDFESWRNPKTGKKKKLLSPCGSLDDCNFNLYQLQLNTYMYMLLQANRGLKLGGMQILHIVDVLDEEGNVVDFKTEPHNVKNLQSMVKQMFEKFKPR